MMRPDMQFYIIYAVAVTALLLSLGFLTLYRRVSHRIRIGGELRYLIGQDQYQYLILDVRSSREYRRGHLPAARNIPFPECRGYLPTENMFEKIYVYGSSRRSARLAARHLGATGYFNVKYYGSFRGWRGPVEMSDEKETLPE